MSDSDDTTVTSIRRQAPTSGHALPEHARLIVVAGDSVGRSWPLVDELRIGRASDCDIILDDGDVSRRHAVVRRRSRDAFHIEDLGSRNGTMLNGARVASAALRFGDKFRVGTRQVIALMPYDPVEEELFQRHRMETLGRLTAGVAHDLNNMLGAVSASSAFLRQLPPDARGCDEAEECLDDIDTAAARAADLAYKLLSFARPADASAAADLSDICRESVTLARRTFDGSIRIDADIAPGVFIDGSAVQLHQVMMNLLVNARDAIGRGSGRIGVRLHPTASARRRVLLSVSDDGCGMDDKTRQHLFEAFYTTKQRGAGFGLGLATVADIVAAHAGEIEVESVQGTGTTFKLELPMLVAQPQRIKASTLAPGAPRTLLSGKRVLLVDDEPVMRRSLQRVLKRHGMEVSAVGDAEQALAQMAQRSFDIAIVDLDLPGMRGDDLVVALRKTCDMPIICVSGHHGNDRIAELKARGAAAFVGKPFALDELMDAAGKALGAARDDLATRG